MRCSGACRNPPAWPCHFKRFRGAAEGGASAVSRLVRVVNHISILAVVSVAVGGCAFDDGLPWGQLDFETSVVFDGSTRHDDQGRVRTTLSYAVRVDGLEVRLDAVSLEASTSGAAATFDPADPPEGYSLCHNGHCHHDSGALVDYEDIALELAGSGAGGPTVTEVYEGFVTPTADGATLTASDCTDGCQLDPSDFRTVRASIAELRVTLHIFDQLTGAQARLPAEGIAVTATVPVGLSASTTVSGTVGEDDPVGARVAVAYDLSTKLFDDVDFQALGAGEHSETEALRDALKANLEEHGQLSVAITRYDL